MRRGAYRCRRSRRYAVEGRPALAWVGTAVTDSNVRRAGRATSSTVRTRRSLPFISTAAIRNTWWHRRKPLRWCLTICRPLWTAALRRHHGVPRSPKFWSARRRSGGHTGDRRPRAPRKSGMCDRWDFIPSPLGAGMESLTVTSLQRIAGSKTIRGWASGTAKDSQDMLEFSALSGVRPMIERYPLAKAADAHDQMISGRARFRVVLTMS